MLGQGSNAGGMLRSRSVILDNGFVHVVWTCATTIVIVGGDDALQQLNLPLAYQSSSMTAEYCIT